MNIFALDSDPAACARAHCDKHVIKMILESAQIMCTVAHVQTRNDASPSLIAYKPTHQHHPCTLWAGASVANYWWLKQLAEALNDEKKHRFNSGDHASIHVIRNLPILEFPGLSATPFAQALPDDCRNPDAIVAYRQYYRKHKTHLHSWSNRERPEWL